MSELIVSADRDALRVEPAREQLVATGMFAKTVNDERCEGCPLDRPVVHGELRSVASAERCTITQGFGSFKV
jgi:hypothetical protein